VSLTLVDPLGSTATPYIMEAVGKLWSEYRARTPQRLKVLVQLPRMILLFFPWSSLFLSCAIPGNGC
jgi:hypothetical protein